MDCGVTVNRHDMYFSLYITQKSSGNGKDLLQIHASTTWVGKNHNPVGRYFTSAVARIEVSDRNALIGSKPFPHSNSILWNLIRFFSL